MACICNKKKKINNQILDYIHHEANHQSSKELARVASFKKALIKYASSRPANTMSHIGDK